MIYKVSEQEFDGDIARDSKQLLASEPCDYEKVIVKKPWGYEYLAFENEHVAIWILHIVRKRKTSMHCHPKKRTSLILLSGQAVFHQLEGDITLKAMDGVCIEKNTFHSTEAFNPLPVSPQSENGIWVMEIESPPHKTDLVRLKDAYGRAGKSYEGKDNMVQDPEACLKLRIPGEGEAIQEKFFDCTFTVIRGPLKDYRPSDDALISVITQEPRMFQEYSFLEVGGIMSYGTFRREVKRKDQRGVVFLIIEREKRVSRVADYVFSRIQELGIRDIFAVSGGGAMHLVDAVGKNEKLNYVAVYHEQAAAMAAEGYARISGKPGCALVTSGPGGTNALTGVCGAWIDSIPSIFISGQVTTNTLLDGTGLRQFGIQESDIVNLMKPVTKYAVTVTVPETIRYHLEKAIYLAATGRPGPVWLDIPLDVQSQLVRVDELTPFEAQREYPDRGEKNKEPHIDECLNMLKQAERPVLICGYGVRLSKAEKEFIQLVEKLGVPVISSWTASDLIPTDHDLYIGRSGIMGSRAGNFTVQNSDLLLIIGSRMSVPQVGYNFKTFAREAKRIVVDVDHAELKKESVKPDLPIKMKAKDFIVHLIERIDANDFSIDVAEWVKRCQGWKKKYPIVLPEYKGQKGYVNSFYFVDVLSRKLREKAIVVTDMGTSFTCTMQTFHVKKGQRLFTSSGHASMGYGLPGAIGACYGGGLRKTICISGDGGLQMNIQELQTLVQYQLPIILFVLNNQGYLTIKLMQQNHFGRFVGSDP